jgi:hypothetical protein
MTTTFSSNPSSDSPARVRSKFTPEGRKRVKTVRKMGACPRCRFRQVAVSYPGEWCYTIADRHFKVRIP